MPRCTVVLDRDGTVVIDREYLRDPEQLEFCPGAVAGLQRLSSLGCRLVVITNQSGIGRGFFDLEHLDRVHAKLQLMLDGLGVKLDGIYFCPHLPEDRCRCRKPETELIQEAARDLGFTPAETFVVGDKASDVELGMRYKARTVLISAAEVASEADFVAKDLLEVAAYIETQMESAQCS